MEFRQISRQQVATFAQLHNADWKTAAQVAEGAQISGRTARQHLANLLAGGALEVLPIFGGYRYRLLKKPTAEGAELVKRLKLAGDVFEETTKGGA